MADPAAVGDEDGGPSTAAPPGAVELAALPPPHAPSRVVVHRGCDHADGAEVPCGVGVASPLLDGADEGAEDRGLKTAPVPGVCWGVLEPDGTGLLDGAGLLGEPLVDGEGDDEPPVGEAEVVLVGDVVPAEGDGLGVVLGPAAPWLVVPLAVGVGAGADEGDDGSSDGELDGLLPLVLGAPALLEGPRLLDASSGGEALAALPLGASALLGRSEAVVVVELEDSAVALGEATADGVSSAWATAGTASRPSPDRPMTPRARAPRAAALTGGLQGRGARAGSKRGPSALTRTGGHHRGVGRGQNARSLPDREVRGPTPQDVRPGSGACA
ncbi:hypothetical protein ACUN7V_07895 [Quadrisphaera oryzae]|uniref:hypothetical protein n=1 Tax=Quadrisphaera TaxID=317661 RepID=UPI0016467813|nr:hypothetical protein [Quadrisphaera sp. RL12-1S]MBC3761693.1 hypothetical protein [Quadrisphaera sp. RL12-1S]